VSANYACVPLSQRWKNHKRYGRTNARLA